MYDLLAELGFRTTKTVWPLHPRTKNAYPYGSLENPRYRDWILDLQKQGFEIAMHGVSDEASPRDRIEEGFRRFSEVLGADPRMHVNHVGQDENIYWYDDRLVGPPRWVYLAWQRLRKRRAVSLGHDALSPYFWGDLLQKRIEYVRNFTFSEINTLKKDPRMPYHSDCASLREVLVQLEPGHRLPALHEFDRGAGAGSARRRAAAAAFCTRTSDSVS